MSQDLVRSKVQLKAALEDSLKRNPESRHWEWLDDNPEVRDGLCQTQSAEWLIWRHLVRVPCHTFSNSSNISFG